MTGRAKQNRGTDGIIRRLSRPTIIDGTVHVRESDARDLRVDRVQKVQRQRILTNPWTELIVHQLRSPEARGVTVPVPESDVI